MHTHFTGLQRLMVLCMLAHSRALGHLHRTEPLLMLSVTALLFLLGQECSVPTNFLSTFSPVNITRQWSWTVKNMIEKWQYCKSDREELISTFANNVVNEIKIEKKYIVAYTFAVTHPGWVRIHFKCYQNSVHVHICLLFVHYRVPVLSLCCCCCACCYISHNQTIQSK